MARTDHYRLSRGSSILLPVTDNDTDPDDNLDPATVAIVDAPSLGVVEVAADGSILYTHQPGSPGDDAFSYSVCDTDGECSAAEVMIDIRLPPCQLTAADVLAFTVDPTSGEPNTEIALSFEVVNEGLEACELTMILFTFDDSAMGAAVPLENNPGAQAVRQVPADAAGGPHRIGAAPAATPADPLAVLNFNVGAGLSEPPGALLDPNEGLDPWVPAAGGGALILIGGLALALRRPAYRHVAITGSSSAECPGMQQQMIDMQDSASDAKAGAAAAKQKADDAEAEASSLRDELAACERAEGRGGRNMPLAGVHMPDSGAVTASGFHLLEFENPQAPLREDGNRGWFYPSRRAAIVGVVLHSAHSASATDADDLTISAANTYTKASGPSSVHTIAGPDGVVTMLPDDYTAFHTHGANGTTLGLEIVLGMSEEDDEKALETAASWFAAKAREHGIPLRHIGKAEWLAGAAGILGHSDLIDGASDPGALFPWDHFLDLADKAKDPPIPVGASVPTTGSSSTDPCADVRGRSTAATANAEAAMTTASEAEEQASEATRAADDYQEEVWDCLCRVPEHQVPLTPDQEEPERRRNKWFLLEHENPHARTRSNGKQGWYKPIRKSPIRGIVVHTAEGSSADGVASYLASVRRPAAGHVVVDPQGWVKLLPDRFAAMHTRGGNQAGLGLLFASYADDWGTDPVSEEAMLRLAAAWCAIRVRLYGIPLRRLTAAEWKAGEKGFIAHSDIDPRRGTDPGDGFDWDGFLSRVGTMSLNPRAVGSQLAT